MTVRLPSFPKVRPLLRMDLALPLLFETVGRNSDVRFGPSFSKSRPTVVARGDTAV
jgi:hypothetical protein